MKPNPSGIALFAVATTLTIVSLSVSRDAVEPLYSGCWAVVAFIWLQVSLLAIKDLLP